MTYGLRHLVIHKSLNRNGLCCTFNMREVKMNWAGTEFKSLDLGDARRNRRAICLMEALSARPTASIPGACGDWADTIGAYRFFSNEAIEWPAILAPHIQSSVTRMAAHDF